MKEFQLTPSVASNFLPQTDAITKCYIKNNDIIVICKKCRSVMTKNSWLANDKACICSCRELVNLDQTYINNFNKIKKVAPRRQNVQPMRRRSIPGLSDLAVPPPQKPAERTGEAIMHRPYSDSCPTVSKTPSSTLRKTFNTAQATTYKNGFDILPSKKEKRSYIARALLALVAVALTAVGIGLALYL